MQRTSIIGPVLALASGLVLLGTGRAVDAQADLRERTAFVSAVDDRGAPVNGLSVNDFIVREDGARREVLRVSRAVEPLDVALLVDNSTAAEPIVVPLREGLRQFVSRMGTANQLAIVGLADRPTVLADYTGNGAALDAGINRIFAQPQSGMTLLDGIVEVARGLETRETARAVIVPIVTDGVEFTNRYSGDVRDALERAGAALHAITIGTFYQSGETVTRERALVLDVVARNSGGQRISLVSATGLESALGRLADELSSQYKVVYGRPQSLIPPETLEVTPARPGVTMRAMPMRRQGA